MSNKKYISLFFLVASLLFFTGGGIYIWDATVNHTRLAIGQIIVPLLLGFFWLLCSFYFMNRKKN